MTPTVEVLLDGHSVGWDQGSIGFCGVYLVEGHDADGAVRRVLFDSGHAGRRRALRRALNRRGLTPSSIDVLVLSHGHWDHLQNADLFAHAPVLAHSAELAYLDAPAAHDHATPPWSKAVLAALDVRETGEGDRLLSGVGVIDLPGHTPGSIGLTVETADGLAVLTGDAVATEEVLRTGRCSGVFHDTAEADASVRRVARLADVVHPGHGRPFRPGAGRLGEPASITLRVPDPEAARERLNFESLGEARFVLRGAESA